MEDETVDKLLTDMNGSLDELKEFLKTTVPDIEEYVITYSKKEDKEHEAKHLDDFSVALTLLTASAECNVNEEEQEIIVKTTTSRTENKISLDEFVEEIQKDINDFIDQSKTPLEIEKMSLQEILNRLKCKCKELKESLVKKRIFKPLEISDTSINTEELLKSHSEELIELKNMEDDGSKIKDKKSEIANLNSLFDLIDGHKSNLGANQSQNQNANLSQNQIANQSQNLNQNQSQNLNQNQSQNLRQNLSQNLSLSPSQILNQDLSQFLDQKLCQNLSQNQMVHKSGTDLYNSHTDLKEFLSIKDYARYFTEDLLCSAVSKLDLNISDNTYEQINSESSIGTSYTDSIEDEPKLTLTIQDFTPKLGKVLIENYIFTWSLTKNWAHCINFLSETSTTCSDNYVYEVKWSIPTILYPIPQATASVFFTIEVSRVKPPACPVKVTYVFETERYSFSIKDDIQHEKFLDNIISCKTAFFKTIRF